MFILLRYAPKTTLVHTSCVAGMDERYGVDEGRQLLVKVFDSLYVTISPRSPLQDG